MARYDVGDEGVIEADPSTVFKACMDDLQGVGHMSSMEAPKEFKEAALSLLADV